MGELFIFRKYYDPEYSAEYVSKQVAGLVRDEPLRFNISGIIIEITKGVRPDTLQARWVSRAEGNYPENTMETVEVSPLAIAHLHLYGRHRAELQILATGVTHILGGLGN